MKKICTLLLLTGAVSMLTLSACNNAPTPVVDDKTINIKSLKGGYGDEWLKALVKKFEAAYPQYKVNYMGSSDQYVGEYVINELSRGYQGVDIYFTDSVVPKNVYNYVESITDVYDSKPIKFDGTEETKTIRQKMTTGYELDQYQVNGVDYNFIFQKAIGGMIYNAAKLSSLGYEEPVTTNQLIKICEEVYASYHANGDEGFLPMTLITNNNSNGYPACMAYALYTQYSGRTGWNKLWSMNKDDGTYDIKNGYTVYEDIGLYEMERVMYHLYDSHYHADDGNQNKDDAHSQIMYEDTGAIFMCDGDWARNEIIDNGFTKEEVANLRFMNFPVISALGTKLWGDQGLSAEIVDKALAKAVKLADENKTATEIAADLNADSTLGKIAVTEAQAEEVIKARGVFVSRGGDTGQAYIAKGGKMTEASKLFLRMFASDDNASLYREKCNGCTPYDSDCGKSTVTDPYFKGFASIATRQAVDGIWPSAKGLRAVVNGGAGNKDFLPMARTYFVINYIYTKSYTQYDAKGDYKAELAGKYDEGAKWRFDEEKDFVSKSWDNWVKGL